MKGHWIWLAVWCSSGSAQPTFEKIYHATGAYKRNLIELSSGNVLVAMGWYPGITILDPNGEFLHSKCFFGDSVLTMQAIRRSSGGQFLFLSSYRKDSCSAIGSTTVPYTLPALGRMDSLGNITNFKHYRLQDPQCVNVPGDLSPTADSGAVFWGRGDIFYAVRVDSALTPVWGKQFAGEGGFHFIKELPGGDLLAGINLQTAGAVVARLDANGNTIWCKSYIRPNGVVHDAVIESDSSFIVTGYTDSTTMDIATPLPFTFHPKLFMMKLDGDGEVQWCRAFDSTPYYWHTPRWSRITAIDGNGFVIAATVGIPGYNIPYRPLLVKTDANGDTLWTSSVGYTGFSHYISDLLACSSGGFMVSGSVQGDLPGNLLGAPFVFRTDAQGRFPCWQWSATVVVQDLFPTDSSFALASLDGATVHSAFVSDTTFAPLTAYDGCTFLPTSIGRSLSVSRRPRVLPNPNTGHFTVQFPNPLMAESYYSVYDALGKLLYQRPLPTGATLEEVDLSRYGRGTYMIKFTNPDGVCHERVVLE